MYVIESDAKGRLEGWTEKSGYSVLSLEQPQEFNHGRFLHTAVSHRVPVCSVEAGPQCSLKYGSVVEEFGKYRILYSPPGNS